MDLMKLTLKTGNNLKNIVLMKVYPLIVFDILFVCPAIMELLLTIFSQCLLVIPPENTRKPVFRGYEINIDKKFIK